MQNNPERRNEREKRERNSLCRFFFHWNKKKKLKLQTSTSASKICPKNARPPSAGDFYWKVPLALSYLTRFSSYLAREQWKSMRYYHFFFLFRERSQRKRISDRKKKGVWLVPEKKEKGGHYDESVNWPRCSTHRQRSARPRVWWKPFRRACLIFVFFFVVSPTEQMERKRNINQSKWLISRTGVEK